MRYPFRYFNSSPEAIRLMVMMYFRYPLSLWPVEDMLYERSMDVCHETVRFWRNRFGPMFAAGIRKRLADYRNSTQWRRRLDESDIGSTIGPRTHIGRCDDEKARLKFAAAPTSICNHFNHDRRLRHRDIFEQSRANALAEWRQLAA
jgi:hypothetical protein